jgi:putative adenylate-forming enzyme
MHLNEDLFILEKRYLSEDRFVPIITDFTRTSQPMIRYELNDVLKERKTPCPCGSVFLGIEQIEGREDDVLVFSTEQGIEKIFADLICRRIAQKTDQFRQYRITQTTEGNLLLELDASAAHFDEIAEGIQKTVLDLLAERQIFGIRFDVQQGVVRQPGEKLRRVVRQKSI